MRDISNEEARRFIEESKFYWHQRFHLTDDVATPGANDIEWLCQTADLPLDLTGKSVLDVGINNGGASFLAERRGASRIVGVDIMDENFFGFRDIKNLLDSKVEYVRADVYTMSNIIKEKFDIVIFFGVLYHLRHPLLALDQLRELTSGILLLETAIDDYNLKELSNQSLLRFYRKDELGNDGTNWFAPTSTALADMCCSAGFNPLEIKKWPEPAPTRCFIKAEAIEPEFKTVSKGTERFLKVV